MKQTLNNVTLRPSRVPWSALASILEISRPNDALPVRVCCPICGKHQLWVYDNSSGGEWAHCFNTKCGFAGDMLELAAATWDIPIEAAVARLKESGLPLDAEETSAEAVSSYARKCLESRSRARQFWHKCRDALAQSRTPDNSPTVELNGLLSRMRLLGSLSAEQWKKGPGRFVGTAPAHQIEVFFRPYERGQGNHLKRSTRKLFRGPQWRDVLVTPSYAAPELLAGFHFLGREGGDGDRAFRQLQRDYGRAPRMEAGLAGLDAVELSGFFPSHVIGFNDPWLALRLQFRHFLSATRPLPLVAWHDAGRHLTQLAWRALHDRKIVLVSRELDAATIYQANQCNGDIWLMPSRHGSRGDGTIFRDLTPMQLVKRAIREARPWRDVLEDWHNEQQPGIAEKLVHDLNMYPDIDAAHVAKELRLYDVRDVLDGVPVREVTLGTSRVIEKADGWYMGSKQKRPEYLLSDAILRIRRILGGVIPARYEGEILFRDERIQFDELASEMERKPARVIVRLCLQSGLGRPTIRPHRYSLIEIATSFHNAEVVKVVPNKAPVRKAANGTISAAVE
jgi:hypothetical protein